MPRPVGVSYRRPLTPDIWVPAPQVAEVNAAVTRVKARLAQREAKKASVDNVGQRPCVARRPAPIASTIALQKKGGNLKAIRLDPARPVKPTRAVESGKPRNEPAGKLTGALPKHLLDVPMAPRATRFQAVNDKPVHLALSAKPKVLPGILRKGGPRGQKKRVAFGGVEERVVERWIGIEQGVESADQLVVDGITAKGRSLHVHPDPCRIAASHFVGWEPVGSEDELEYRRIFGSGPHYGAHHDCTNAACNRVLRRRR